MAIIKCKNCGKQEEHHAKGLCDSCYKKQWKPTKIVTCKQCGKEKIHHAFRLCKNCHLKLYHYDSVKAFNYRKWHNISIENYRKITKLCAACGFDKVVDLHHLDGNHKNNSELNLIGLCPNHHKMWHTEKFRAEVEELLKERLNQK